MIRNEVRRKLTDLIAASGITGNAVVTEAYPGSKNMTSEAVFGDRTQGAITFPYGMAPPRIQRDRFAVLFVVQIQAGKDMPAASRRAQELGNLIATLLADNDLLGFGTATEEITDTNPDGVGIQVDTREGETPTNIPVAIAEITVPFESQTINAQEG